MVCVCLQAFLWIQKLDVAIAQVYQELSYQFLQTSGFNIQTATYLVYVENKVSINFLWHFLHMHCVYFVENALFQSCVAMQLNSDYIVIVIVIWVVDFALRVLASHMPLETVSKLRGFLAN